MFQQDKRVGFILEMDECASNPCINGGTCVNLIIGYGCRCINVFFGKRCESKFMCD